MRVSEVNGSVASSVTYEIELFVIENCFDISCDKNMPAISG